MKTLFSYLIETYRRNRSNSKGLAMLEYAAGALVIATVVWGAMSNFGGGLNSFFSNLGTWLTNEAQNIPNINP